MNQNNPSFRAHNASRKRKNISVQKCDNLDMCKGHNIKHPEDFKPQFKNKKPHKKPYY